MRNIVIFGSSGHAKVILDSIKKEGKYKIVGFIDSYKCKDEVVCGYRILGTEDELPSLIDKLDIHGGIVAVGDNWQRKKFVERILEHIPDFNFITVIHPKAVIDESSCIGKGSVIMANVVVNSECEIGDFCILNTSSTLDHDGKMGQYSSLAPGVCTGGQVVLKEFSAICLGAKVNSNITIGCHSVIGAGSLVMEGVDSYCVSYGTPAKKVRTRKAGDAYLTFNK